MSKRARTHRKLKGGFLWVKTLAIIEIIVDGNSPFALSNLGQNVLLFMQVSLGSSKEICFSPSSRVRELGRGSSEECERVKIIILIVSRGEAAWTTEI
jgi:hypothetical protein